MTGDQSFESVALEGATRLGPSRTMESGREAATRRSALWAAFGDALGWISELTDEAGLARRTQGRGLQATVAWKRHIGGRAGLTVLLPAGCYSDDTQLRLATSRAIGTNGFDVEAFAKVELPVWLGYSLGGGNATKAAAANLAKPSIPWFLNAHSGWRQSGGNGAAMRIQPHVWASTRLDDPSSWILDVVRNAVCTHGHPVGIIGAVIHGLALAHAMHQRAIPTPDELAALANGIRVVPSLISRDPEVGHLWMSNWEREAQQDFDGAWSRTIQDSVDAIARAAEAVRQETGSGRYDGVVRALNLRDPALRGSGLLTAVAAVALGWCAERPAGAMQMAVNALGTDTDTIATMAGALLGAASDEEPPGEILDRPFIASEAHRLAAIARGERPSGHRYPDLLTWIPPRTQADALVATSEGQLQVLGLGPVRDIKSDFLPGPQGEFGWQWVELALGQTLLIKRRTQLNMIATNRVTTHVGEQKKGRSRSLPISEILDAAGPRSSSARVGPEVREKVQTSLQGELLPAEPHSLDLERAIAYLRKEHRNDGAIGYTLRRVAREGTAEQIDAFVRVLLEILRGRA